MSKDAKEIYEEWVKDAMNIYEEWKKAHPLPLTAKDRAELIKELQRAGIAFRTTRLADGETQKPGPWNVRAEVVPSDE